MCFIFENIELNPVMKLGEMEWGEKHVLPFFYNEYHRTSQIKTKHQKINKIPNTLKYFTKKR